jgi:hypothetical protein
MATYEQLMYNSPDGAQIGKSATEKVAFYGAVPVVQRPYSSAVHATSAQATSTDFGATQLATLREIQTTLIGLGVWATV